MPCNEISFHLRWKTIYELRLRFWIIENFILINEFLIYSFVEHNIAFFVKKVISKQGNLFYQSKSP